MTDPKSIAEEATKPTTFNLIDRLTGRGLPKDTVDIYFDEETGYALRELEKQHAKAKNDARAVALEAKIKATRAKLEESKYTFTLTGITNDEHDELVDRAYEEHPAEYQEYLNPLTGLTEKIELPNQDRDSVFNTMLLAACIVSVSDADGGIDDDITEAKVAFIKKKAPLDGIRLITETVTKMRMAAQWMDQLTDPDF